MRNGFVTDCETIMDIQPNANWDEEGPAEIIGGTGKFANIKGSGAFAIQICATGVIATETQEIGY